MIRFRVVPDFSGVGRHNMALNFYHGSPVPDHDAEPLEVPLNRALKRGFDIAFSLLVLVFVFPFVFWIVAPLILLTSPGSVFFRQVRTGRDGKEFYCLKFRTMGVNKTLRLRAGHR